MNNMAPGILFVDDEDQARKYFIKAFSKDFKILTASSVSEAKAILQDQGSGIGVLITDMRMPGENGVVLLDHAKKSYPHIVRLLTTGYSDLGDAIAAVNNGEIIRYIEKPWDLDALNAELLSALRYFQLQSERDQLLDEKLSVKRRMTEIDQVRDLLVMGESLSHLENPALGIRSMLHQAKVSSGLDNSEKSLEMWGLFEKSLTNSLNTAKALRQRIRPDGNSQRQTISVDELVHYAIEPLAEAVQLELTRNDKQATLNVDSGLFRQLLASLLKLVRDKTGDPEASVHLCAESKDKHIVFDAQPRTDNGAAFDGHRINNDMIEIFLLAAHHQGDVELHSGDFGMRIRLPLEDAPSLLKQPDSYDFEEMVSLYEV